MKGKSVKVVNFPGYESMWVTLVSGHENEGTGRLDNNPVCSDLKMGDIIAFDRGCDDWHPQYAGRVGC